MKIKESAIEGENTMSFEEFDMTELKNSAPDSPEAQLLVKKWQDWINTNFYNCTKELLCGLGQMYVTDERFTQTIDQNGIGTAKFMAETIAVYCAK